MMSKLLTAIGLLTVLGLAGFTAAGLMVLKDRVQVTIQDGDAGARPDPGALLRDDLQALTAQLDRLSSAIADNFGKLHEASETSAQQRQGELLAALRGVDAAQQQLGVLAAAMQRSEQALAALPQQVEQGVRAAVAALPVAGPAPAATQPLAAQPLASEPLATQPAVSGGQGEAEPQGDGQPTQPQAAPRQPDRPAAPANPDAAPKPAAKTFLTFSMPDSGFQFGEPQDYVILSELSRVGFDAKSTLHDFTGVTSDVDGAFRADFDDPKGDWRGEVSCKAATLATGVDGRDEGLRERLDTDHHPRIRFELRSFVPAKDGVSVAQQTARGEVVGTMHIRGESRELRMPVKVSVDASKRVLIEGEVPLKLTDYKVPVPSQLGLINMQDEVKVWVSLRARKKAGR